MTGGSQTGASTGDVLIVLAMLSLGAAIVYPMSKRRAFESRLTTAIADVEGLRAEATRLRDDTGSWPPSASPGEPPARSQAEGAFEMARETYSLQWSRLGSSSIPQPDTSELPPPDDEDNPPTDTPPPMPTVFTTGAISVLTGEDDLIGALMSRYGSERSFVRDTTWTLLLSRIAAPADQVPPTTVSDPLRRRD